MLVRRTVLQLHVCQDIAAAMPSGLCLTCTGRCKALLCARVTFSMLDCTMTVHAGRCQVQTSAVVSSSAMEQVLV